MWNSVLYKYSIIYSSATALLPFAVSPIIHGLLLLRSSQKKYYSISGSFLKHLYFIISPQASAFFSFSVFFSSVVSVMKGLMPSNQLHFFSKKSPSELMVYFIDKSISAYFVLNLQNISALCGSICQLMKCQNSIMEK
jgi:hypothetical protein